MGILDLALVGLVVRLILSSLCRRRGSEASLPTRSFGPGRSWSMATGWWRRSLTCRIVLMLRTCWSWVPCEKLIRATFIPDWISWVNTLGESDAGPIVQTIL